MILKESIDAVMHATDIVEVIGDFVHLKRSGSNMQGLCPFHNEKTPSFSVSPAKQIYKCFGCGEAGNSVTFLMNAEKMSYVEAIRYLADKYHIELQETEMSEEFKETLRESDSISIVNAAAQKYFQSQIWETEEGKAVGLSYFKERGLSEETINKYGLGYSPESKTSFYTWAIENGYNQDILLKAGLISERDGSYYDKYSGRVIFPIYNLSGKVLGFGARILDSTKKTAKYLNSPENELYHKSKTLYGLFQNKREISSADYALMTEGYMDVISLADNDLNLAVASSGTSLTSDQARLIKKYNKTIIILYDSDDAGVKASLRAIDICLEEGLNIYVVQLSEGEDPDSYVRKHGKQGLLDYIDEHKLDFVDFTYETLLSSDPQNLTKRNEASNQLAQSIAKITRIEDISLRSSYVQKAAEKIGVEEKAFLTLVNKYQREDHKNKSRFEEREAAATSAEDAPLPSATETAEPRIELSEMSLLKLLIEDPLREMEEDKNTIEWLDELIDQGFILQPKVISFFKNYKNIYDEKGEVTERDLTQHQDPAILETAISLLHSPHKVSENWARYHIDITDEKEVQEENFEKTVIYYQLRVVKKMIVEELNKLEDARELSEIRGIQESIRSLKNAEKAMTEKLGTIILK